MSDDETEEIEKDIDIDSDKAKEFLRISAMMTNSDGWKEAIMIFVRWLKNKIKVKKDA